MLSNLGPSFFKKLGKNEKALLYFSISLVLVSALLIIFVSKYELRSKNYLGLQKIGQLEIFGPDVKRKFHGEPDFSDLQNEDPLFQKDTVFVGPGSKAKFILPEYGDFELEPNSVVMVVLDFEKAPLGKNIEAEIKEKPKGLRLKLLQGKMKFEAKKPSPVESKNNVQREEAPEIFVEVSDNTVLKLGDQKEAVIEKAKNGNFEIASSTKEIKAFRISADPSQKDEEIVLPTKQVFSENDRFAQSSQIPPEDLTSSPPQEAKLIQMPAKPLIEENEIKKEEKVAEAFYRWGAKSPIAEQHNEEIKEILKEYNISKAGNVELGDEDSGGKYFHFYVSNNDKPLVESKIATLLGASFYKEQVTDQDAKAKAGNSRVVFVLFEEPQEKQMSRKTASASTRNSTEETDESWSEYQLLPSIFYSAINSKDKASGATTNFYSKQNYELSGSWIQHWNQKWSSLIGLGMTQESWDQSFTSGRTLTNKSYLASNFFAGAKLNLARKLSFATTATVGQESFRVSQNSGTEIKFETPVVAKVALEAKKYFSLTKRFSFGLGLNPNFILPRSLPNYNVRLSPGLKLLSSIRQELSIGFMEAGLFYAYQKLSTNILEETRSNFGLSLVWSFGKQDENPDEKATERGAAK